MIKGIEYTQAMDDKIREYQKSNLLTTKDFSDRVGIAESSLYKFRNRRKISVQSLKKIKERAGLDLS